MAEPEELVELGGVAVPSDRLLPDVSEIDDRELRAAIERVQREPIGEPVPRVGWRVLTRDAVSVTVGAFDDETWHGWCTMTLRRVGQEWRADGAAYGQHPRPTPAVRGRGLALQFSDSVFRCKRGAEPNITVTLTNDSGSRFRETTSWCALGHLLDLRSGHPLPTEDHLGIASLGRDLDLGVGDTAELPVVLFTRATKALPPGEYGVTASFNELELRAEGGRLRVG